MAGIYSNTLREPPETEIAPFVSSHDKPTTTTGGKPISGDAAEQQLKAEIMALPARERHRLKQLADQGQLGSNNDDFQRIMRSIKEREVIKPPDVVPASAGGFNKTNWELEIGKRFELPLFSESNEFPDSDMIQKRMIPLCYQEGLAGGAGTNAADLVTVAAEMFVKQMLTDSFRRTRANGVNYIQTAGFKRKLAREEGQLGRGAIKRDGFGLLPAEQEVERHRAPFGMEDLRFSLSLGGNYMVQNKLLTARIIDRPLQRMESREMEVRSKASGGRLSLTNGVNGHGSGSLNMGGPVMKMERSALDDTLDDILDFGY
jgi:transcriptional coactivator HFI1/ADA1